MLRVILSMHESRWFLSRVPELPLFPAVAFVGTVIPELARVVVVESVVPVVVTTVIVAEGGAVAAVTSISSIMNRSAKSPPLGLGTAIAMGSQVSILSVFQLMLMKGVRLPLSYCWLTIIIDSLPLDGSVCSFYVYTHVLFKIVLCVFDNYLDA